MTTPVVDNSSLQTEFDADLAKGYRGARVDPNPDSAYSQKTDPMTSPGVIPYNKSQINIDEYADPDNPDTPVYGRPGITDAELTALDLQTITQAIAAEATAGTGQTTKVGTAVEFDGTVTGATFNPTATITGDATNNRTFKLHNDTAGHPLFTITTTATKTAGVAVAMTADGSDQTVSAGDELSVIETTGGTGIAHGGASVVATVTEHA